MSWNFLGPSTPASRVVALAVDPRNDAVIYLAAPGGGLWKTDSAGSAWSPLTDSAVSLQVCSVALDPRAPDVVYLGTGDDQSPRGLQGVARSIDGGRNWSFGPRFTNQPVCTVAVDPADSTRVFAGSAEGLFLSTDSGGNWTKIVSTATTSVAFDGQGAMYAGLLNSDRALSRSSDGGTTWTAIPLPPNVLNANLQPNWVSIVASGSTLSLAVSYPGSPQSQVDFYRTTDAGTTWTTAFRIGQARPPMTVLTLSTGTLYVTGISLMRSLNNGISWETVSTTGSEYHTGVLTGGGLLLGGGKGLVTLSVTAGVSLPLVRQVPIAQFLKMSVDTTGGIWAAGPGGLFGPLGPGRTADTATPGVASVGFVASATTGSTNIFAAGNNRVYSSTDSGLHFASRSVIPDAELRAPLPPLIIDPVTTSTAYVAGTRIYRTTNSGTSWTALGTVDPDPTHVVVALALAPAARTVFFAATACLPELVVAGTACPATSLIWRSGNAGLTWVQVNSIPGLVDRITIDPMLSNIMYAAVGAFPGGPSLTAGFGTGDLLISQNGGGQWNSIRGNLPRVPINAVIIDPTALSGVATQPLQKLYVATDSGVFVTFNAAGTTTGGVPSRVQWIDITGSVIQSLPPSPVTDLLLLPGGTLVAATFGRGVYSTTTASVTRSLIVEPLLLDVSLMQGGTLTTGVPLTNVSTTNVGWRLSGSESWVTVPQVSGTLGPQGSAQAAIRVSAANLALGTYLTHLQVVSAGLAQNILLQVHVTGAPAKISFLNGDTVNGAFGAAVSLQVVVSDARLLPLSGVTVAFSVVSGTGMLSTRSVQTNSAGIAATVLTLPATAGVVRVMASNRDLSATVTITAAPAPSFLAESVFDGVTLNAFTSLGPGSIVAIAGQNLADSIQTAPAALLPTSLGTTRVVLVTAGAEIALPLISASPTQVRAVLPTDLAAGTYSLRVVVGTARSNDVQISTASYAPGIFTTNGSGRGPGVFLKDDGSVVTVANPADRGSNVTFYAAGFGPVSPSVALGQPGAVREPLNRTLRMPRVVFDTYPAQVLYSGLALGIAGRYQVTVRVPALISPATNVSVSLSIGGFASNRVTIPVR